MEKLKKRLGKPPYVLDDFILLRGEGLELLQRIQANTCIDLDALREKIEMLEAMAALLELRMWETFPEKIPKVGSWAANFVAHHDRHRAPELIDVLESFPTEVLQLKRHLFELLQLPELHSAEAGFSATCQYCHWAVDRLSDGTRNPSERKPIREFYDYLCAVDEWPDLGVLQGRSQKGCELCDIIRRSFVSTEGKDHDIEHGKIQVWLRFCWNTTPWVNGELRHCLRYVFACLSSHRTRAQPARRVFVVESRDNTLGSELGLLPPPEDHPLSPANLAWIGQQMQASDHVLTEASSNHDNTFIPERLIDLGLDSETPPRLVESSSPNNTADELQSPSAIKYATLSYFWGTPEQAASQLMLSVENQSELRRAIPLHLLPQVVHDAFTACRGLGIRYLWIDALCIVQQGLQTNTDWEKQNVERSRTFEGSWLTLCAPISQSCLQGFLDRRMSRFPIVRFKYPSSDASTLGGTFMFRYRDLEQDSFAFLPPLALDLERSVWNTRGWIFQEKCLSPRKLFFGQEMLHFQFGSTVVSENGCRQSVDRDHPRTTPYPPHLSNGIHNPTVQTTRDYWYNIVEQFSRSSRLTNELDLFPALSGIAAAFQRITHEKFLAGLWENDIHCGLLWHVGQSLDRSLPTSLQDLLQRLRGSGSKLAPSWSWAGKDGLLLFSISDRVNMCCRVRAHLRPEISLVETYVEAHGAVTLGMLASSSLSLSGKATGLSTGSLHESAEPGSWIYSTREGFLALVEPDWDQPKPWIKVEAKALENLRLVMTSSCCSEWSHSELDKADKDANAEEASLDMLLTFMKPEYRKTTYHNDQSDPRPTESCSFCSTQESRRDVWGLLLYQGTAPDTYYRVGTFLSRAEHGGSDIFEQAQVERFELL